MLVVFFVKEIQHLADITFFFLVFVIVVHIVPQDGSRGENRGRKVV